MKRTLGTIAVASALPLVLFACSSSHNDEPQGTTSSDLLNCSPGYEECTFETGHRLCYCVEPTPVCSVVPPLAYEQYVAAWAVVPYDGACPPIRGNGGSWAQIGSVPMPPGVISGNGVPTDTATTVPNCQNVYPTAATCCTYVWWPTNLTTSTTPYAQDNSVVCTQNTEKMQAIIEDGQPYCPPEIDGGCHGGSTCGTCIGNWP